MVRVPRATMTMIAAMAITTSADRVRSLVRSPTVKAARLIEPTSTHGATGDSEMVSNTPIEITMSTASGQLCLADSGSTTRTIVARTSGSGPSWENRASTARPTTGHSV